MQPSNAKKSFRKSFVNSIIYLSKINKISTDEIQKHFNYNQNKKPVKIHQIHIIN